MKRIQSKLHKIATYNVCKISLSCFDVKRYILNDGINNLSYFEFPFFSALPKFHRPKNQSHE